MQVGNCFKEEVTAPIRDELLRRATSKRRSGCDLFPVFSFWNPCARNHTAHFLPAWPGEQEGGILFYAVNEAVRGAEPYYAFWHRDNKDHSIHQGDPWGGEALPAGSQPVFYAWPCSGNVGDGDKEPKEPVELAAVHQYWNETNQDHTYHFPPAWGGEQDSGISFYALKRIDAYHEEKLAGLYPESSHAGLYGLFENQLSVDVLRPFLDELLGPSKWKDPFSPFLALLSSDISNEKGL